MSATTAIEPGTVVQAPPGSLLIERNIRDAKPDPELVASIKDVGVLEPISAVLNDEGQLVVRFGHRRTLAAIKAKVETVPVYVLGTDSTDAHAEVDRIIRQRDENTHRAGLTTAEEVGVVAQLAMFGLSADQIAEQARIGKDRVQTALVVTESKMATKAAAKWDDLTLDQVAAIAEFEHDKDAVQRLVEAARSGRFEHTVQRMRDDLREEQERAAVKDGLRVAGVKVVDRPNYDDKTKRLDSLKDKATGELIDPEAHASCPGHVAWTGVEWTDVDADGVEITDEREQAAWEGHEDDDDFDPFPGSRRVQKVVPIFGCEAPAKHGHVDRYGSGSSSKPSADEMTEEEREKAKAERKLVIENNKAWASAETVRRDWLATFAKRKTAPKGTGEFLAAAITLDADLFDWQSGPVDLLADWLGVKAEKAAIVKAAEGQTDARALHIALLRMLAVYETARHAMGQTAWRENGQTSKAGRYLRFLASCGYPLSEVEEYAISKRTV